MEFSEIIHRALVVRDRYEELEKDRYGKAWTGEQLMQGFVGDVGDLAKLIMAKSGYRAIDEVDVRLAHELADCLWSVLVLANVYDIDIEQAFLRTMNDLEKQIANDRTHSR